MAKDYFKIDDNIKQVTRKLDYYQKRVVPDATAASINKGAAKARTQNARSLAAIFQLPQKLIRRRMRIKKANKKTLKGRFWLGLFPVSARYFGPRENRPNGVTAREGYHNRKAFIAKVGAGSTKSGRAKYAKVVLTRKGRAKYPTKTEKIDISAKADGLSRKITRSIFRTFFPRELRRQIEWRANKLAGIK